MVGTATIRIAGTLAAVLAGASVLADTAGGESSRVATMLAGPMVSSGVEAYFRRESYRPGDTATLVVETPLRTVDLTILRTGDVPIRGIARDEMRGAPVTESRLLDLDGGRPLGRRTIRVTMGDWPSGVYYAELRSASGLVGYAPFVLAPRRLGQSRVAVVMPTNTWFAYNRRDADGDGVGDTWYESWTIRSVDMTRAYLDRGVPPSFARYDLPFLRWLFLRGRQVDMLSQRELEARVSGEALARAYGLIVFSGHHEYVARQEYDVIERYRDLGGNLMFLSANNYYWRVVKRGDRMSRAGKWRDLGRPEAALVGVRYIGNDGGRRRAPYHVVESPAGAWLLAGTGLEPGSTFGSFGIEIDHTAPSSPKGTQVVAEIRDLFAPGKTAQMTYYETPAGARVFAAGAFTLAGQALQPTVVPILENLWTQLATE